MALDEHQVITSQVPETVQQTFIFIQRWLWFVDHHCFSIVLRLPSYVRKGFIIGLEVVFYQASYQFMAFITVFREYWELSLFISVITANIYEGTKEVSVVLTTWLGDTCLHNRWILLYSTLSYFIGLALWVFSRGNKLLVPGLFFILVGQCGYESYLNRRDKWVWVRLEQENNNGNDEQSESANLNQNNGQDQGVIELEEFNNSQERGVDKENGGHDREITLFLRSTKAILKKKRSTRAKLVKILKTNLILILGVIIATFFFPDEQVGYTILTWILLGIFIILFLNEIYNKIHKCSTKKLEGSPFSIIFKVYILAFTKRNDDNNGRIIYTGDIHAANQQIDGNIRFLDRAALYNPSTVDPSVEFDQGRLCTLQQVEDTKRFTNAIRLSLSFIMYGVMTAVADTFFLETVDIMDSYIGKFDVPTQVFVMTSDLVRNLVSCICKKWIAKKVNERSRRRFYGALRVGTGMLLSVPCFGIAFIIQKKTLEAHKADVKISAFWLIPQLILVGLMDGLTVDGMKCFFEQEMPTSIGKKYGEILSNAIVGLGKLLGVGWFCFWYFITKIDDKSGWFGHDIQTSHLDYYYAVMAGFGLFSTLVYAYVVTKHSYS